MRLVFLWLVFDAGHLNQERGRDYEGDFCSTNDRPRDVGSAVRTFLATYDLSAAYDSSVFTLSCGGATFQGTDRLELSYGSSRVWSLQALRRGLGFETAEMDATTFIDDICVS